MLISYVSRDVLETDVEKTAKLLQNYLIQVGFSVDVQSVYDTETLEEQHLQDKTFLVVLCTPEYAKKIKEMPAIRKS